MTLDPNTKSALRERLNFYRELGVGPIYRREVGEHSTAVQSDEHNDIVVESVDADVGPRLSGSRCPPATYR